MADAIAVGLLLPKWRSHKVVRAQKICEVRDGSIYLEGPYPPITPANGMFARYVPVPGDYYVVYDDGYASISPKQAFEDGYTRIEE